jgi:hypothetical protein
MRSHATKSMAAQERQAIGATTPDCNGRSYRRNGICHALMSNGSMLIH